MNEGCGLFTFGIVDLSLITDQITLISYVVPFSFSLLSSIISNFDMVLKRVNWALLESVHSHSYTRGFSALGLDSVKP